ncbi:MAG: shikimate dehydrogenase [Opitutus sp.]|nr:shikimate dehydrogenase [Opitutus sp.]
MSHDLKPATRPTMYFIGVTTRQSSINQVFPLWADHLQLGDCELRGLDFPLHDRPERYRAAVDFIKRDPLSLGALVTTHKIDLCHACRDQFDVLDPLTASLGEVGSIFKRAGRLHGRAVDPWTSGYALEAILPRGYWRNGGEALILGTGGAGTALAWHLANPERGSDRPVRIHVADRVTARLEQVRQLHASWAGAVPLECHLVSEATAADALVLQLPPGSLVVNATGVGKDIPGSPLSDAVVFPYDGTVWEFNYRGNLVLLEQARAQKEGRRLRVVDGWGYFLHGWTRVMADVFDREIPTHGPLFEALGEIAARTR